MNLDKQRVGDYVLTEQVGQDKTGTVYRGSHATSANPVTVKVLNEKYNKDPALVARFKTQAETLRGIRHPSIVEVVDHGASASGLYLVMEDLAGESLADRLKRDRRLPLAETQRIVAAVAGALAAAHRLRLVHRDLHAENVFLVKAASDGQVKVLGLGLAKILGQPAPGSGREVDQRADIHALGSLAYEMLSGCTPLPGRAAGGSHANQRMRPAPLSTHGVAVPRAVEAAIMKALERKKKRRFSSMAEFAQAFGVVLAPITAVVPEPEPVLVSPPVQPPAAPAVAGPERANTLTGLVRVRARQLGRTMRERRQMLAGIAGVGAAVLAISWLVLRSGGPTGTVANDVKPPQPQVRVVQPPQMRPQPSPSAPSSRVDEILALNQQAVSAYAQSDVRTARALLENADKLAIASGYQNAMVRAQTQVRLGALWIGGQKNPRVGRRYFAKAVAINPEVNLPASMVNPQVRKAFHAVRTRARVASSRGWKRTPRAKHPKGG